MKRRVLLIDADTDFRDTLTHQLGRYRVSVNTEVDPDKAIGLAQSDPPDLIVIAVEEPDKAGFRAFQKARKQLPAKLPIILVTKSMSPDSFSKHRSLKVRADEYIDKREASNEELVGKIDNLITLGDVSDEAPPSLDDDIPMELADGDVVLDEHLEERPDDDENRDFDVHSANTVGPNSSVTVDQMVSAETDAAFDMLMGDEAVPSPVPAKKSKPIGLPGLSDFQEKEKVTLDGLEDSAIPEPVPHKIPDEPSQVVDAVPAPSPDADSVPKPIEEDSSRLDPDSVRTDGEPGADSEFSSEEPVHVEPPDEAIVQERDSLAGIPLVDDDLVALDDDALEEIEEEPSAPTKEPSSPVPQPIGAPISEPSTQEPLAAKEPSAPLVEPAVPRNVVAMEPTTPATETTVTREPIVTEAALKPGSGAHPPVDLGLDVLAQDAEREQSGLYDRRSLRKIGELERQIAQLKNELERARAAAESPDRGTNREHQFIKLRETTLARETELKQVKTKFDQQSKELAEAQEKLRQALTAKTALETKSTELDQEIEDVRTKNKELAASLKDATAQASQLEQELDAKTRSAAAAEKALAQAEKDLTTERANRAASASESERALRLERDQLLARHKGELAMLRAETEAATELGMVRVREECEVEKVRAVNDAIEETKRIAAQERTEAITVIENNHNAALLDIRRQHADALTAQKNELDVEIEKLKTQIIEAQASGVAAVAAAEGAAKDELDRVRGEHAAELTRLGERHNEAMLEFERKLEELQKAHEHEKTELESAHRHALADLRSRNDQEVAQLTDAAKKQIETHRAELADERAKHESLLAAANDTAEQQLAEQKQLVRQANEELEQAKAKWQAEREELLQQNASAIGEMQTKHERELAVAQGEHAKAKAEAETAHRHAIEALKAEADRMLRQLEAERDRNIEELQRERDELQKGLSGARDSLQRSQGELATAVQTIAERNHELREHAKAIAERDARIAQLRGEIESLEQENASYQEQVLRAYQKIKADEAMVARARKAMAIALTVLDDQGNPTESSS